MTSESEVRLLHLIVTQLITFLGLVTQQQQNRNKTSILKKL